MVNTEKNEEGWKIFDRSQWHENQRPGQKEVNIDNAVFVVRYLATFNLDAQLTINARQLCRESPLV